MQTYRKFEYRRFDYGQDTFGNNFITEDDVIKLCNKLGKQGWEIIKFKISALSFNDYAEIFAKRQLCPTDGEDSHD